MKELLKKLIAIKSPSKEEKKLAKFIKEYFKKNKFKVLEHEGNIIVHMNNNSNKCILFNAHMDTVKAQGEWRTDPCTLTESNGKYYGLGVSDEKVSIAILMKLALLLKNNPNIHSDIILIFVVEEETSGKGSVDFIKFFQDNWHYKESACIICEPRNASYLGVGSKGNIFFKAKFKGHSCHSSEPNKGDNAIINAMKFKLNLDTAEDKLGPATIAYPTKILGGSTINSVPDLCITYGDIRTNTLVHENILNQLQNLKFIEILSESKPYLASSKKLISAFHTLGITEQTTTHGSNDAVFFENAGIPTVIFGAGNEECCHISNEFVEIKNIQKTKDIYLQFCENYFS